MDTKELKKRILDFAIRGCLTEQKEEDGTAEELYQKIQDEKNFKFKGKKLTEEDSFDVVLPTNIPFDIPKTWKWVKLSEICSQITDGTHKTPTYQGNGIPFLSVKNISSGYLDMTDTKYISQEEHTELINRCKPEKNDILICRIGTLGKALRIDTDSEFSIFVSLGLIKIGDQVLADYITNVINSGFGADWIQSIKAGGAMHAYKINLADLNEMLIPLPPYEEQKRIEGRVKELFSLLDTINILQNQYQDNLATLKSKIIDAGIQGKLTEQLPEDGTAEELYQQIQQEKLALEKTGKIKKTKPLPPISDEEKPFDIPENWKWVRIGGIANAIYAGGDKPEDFSKVKDNTHLIPVVGNGVENEGILGYTGKPTAKAYTVTVAGRGTIGFSVFRQYEYCPVVRLIVIEQNANIDPRYIQYVLQALPESGVGSSIPQLTVPMLTPKVIPLPPLAEQKRIVAKLEELLAVCEKG